jgi:hypothetical protein
MLHQDSLHVARLRSDEVSRILAWRYDGPYSVYNTAPADAARLQNEMLEVGGQFLAVRDSTGLIGFCSFRDGRTSSRRHV